MKRALNKVQVAAPCSLDRHDRDYEDRTDQRIAVEEGELIVDYWRDEDEGDANQ